jgi:tRNA A37 threonylcarbamoyladenosine biosynthesis protein TsaE
MWSDNESDVDLLQYKYLASAAQRIVTSPNLSPTTIGFFGDWGSGKSTLVQLLGAELEKDKSILCLTFNGWLFEGYDDAKTALMGSILDAIQERIQDDKSLGAKAMELLKKLVHRVDWLHLAGLAGKYALPAVAGYPQVSAALAGGDALKFVAEKAKDVDLDEAKKLLKEAPEGQENIRRNIRDFRKDFEELLTASKISRLVVFVDDLDRCLPDTIIETLEAIKLFLFVKGTAFVLAADERLVQYAVRQRFPELPGTETEVGRDYLEKLIQIPLRIPPLSGPEIESYINILFAQLRLEPAQFTQACAVVAAFRPTADKELSFDLDACRAIVPGGHLPEQLQSDFDLTAQIAPVLTPGLGGSPRRTKRFLNTLLLRMQLSEDRGLTLQRRVLAKLMLLEYLKPEFFVQLAQLQSSQGGKPTELAAVEGIIRRESGAATEAEPTAVASAEEEPAARGRAKAKSAKSEPADDDAPAVVQPWLADGWMRNWLASEPILAAIDLRPYFYIAHDSTRTGALEGTATRLSPAAADVLNKLLAPGEVTRTMGLQRSANLNSVDATAVFQNLAARLRQAEALDATSPQAILFKFVQYRPELVPQLITLYGSLREAKVPVSVPTLFYPTVKGTSSEAAGLALLEQWAKSTHGPLANAAKAVIKRLRAPAPN